MTAAHYGNKSLVKLLLEYNANLDAQDSSGRVAWEIAEEMGQYECAELLLNEMGMHFTIKKTFIHSLKQNLFD